MSAPFYHVSTRTNAWDFFPFPSPTASPTSIVKASATRAGAPLAVGSILGFVVALLAAYQL